MHFVELLDSNNSFGEKLVKKKAICCKSLVLLYSFTSLGYRYAVEPSRSDAEV